MKILALHKIYIQRCDLQFLIQNEPNLPSSILSQNTNFNDNKFEFIAFDNPEDIQYLNRIDYIIDYEKMKKLSTNELVNLLDIIHIKGLNNMKEQVTLKPYKIEKLKALAIQQRQLSYKFYAINDFLTLKKEGKEICLPENLNLDNRVSIKEQIKTLFKKKH